MTRAALAVALALVAGCSNWPFPLTRTDVMLPREFEEQASFVPIARQQAWINPPGLRFAMQRGLVNGSEQRLLLENLTAVKGDNLIVLRSRNAFGFAERLRYGDLLRRVGGLPPPFAHMKSGDLTAESDEAGGYLWAEERYGVNTVCVLALRRIDETMRQLPPRVKSIDMMMRNCVNGTAEEALVPIRAAAVDTSPLGAPAQGSNRMLSPLAGPVPR